uniref:NADH dehydrogenase subunit 3 n=1 Tax=Dactylogyrus tuba TaxID=231340 RepID=UPI002E76E6FE|nr:NADH dehydrogenase subunit 3 [Dactylogyrus tuba]WCF76311.1 NADH dehydrogenase subunit 3 [Dactylogyrus tuba]
MLGVLFVWLLVAALVGLYNSNFYAGFSSDNYNAGVWSTPFECGFISHPVKINSFSSGVFVLLVFFVVFDLEVSLLLNIVFQEEFFKNLGYYCAFLLVVAVGFVAEVTLGFVRWHN